MKQYIYGLLLAISSSLLFNSSNLSAQSSTSYEKQTQSVLVFGDSLSAAYNIPVEQGWVSLLQDLVNEKDLKVKIINASISGETTSGGLDRLEKQLKIHSPQIVLLELGGNDGLRGLALTATRENLTQMVSLAHQYSARVLLAGIKIPPNYGRTYTQRFEQIYTDLAKREQVELIPFILAPIEGNLDLLQVDGIHPKAEAQPLIRDLVAKYLFPML